MKMFKSKRDKVREFLKGKDWQTVEDIALGVDLSKTKTKTTLEGLKGKEVEFQDDKWKLIDIPPQAVVEQQQVTPPEAISPAVVQEPNPEIQHEGLTAKIDDMNRQLNLVLGVKETKEKKAKLKRFSLGKLKRYNKGKYRSVILMGNDQSLRLVKGEYFDAYKIIKVGKLYHQAGAIHTWLWEKKQPCMIIHENSLEPIMSKEVYEEAKTNGTLINAQYATVQACMMVEQDQEGGEKKKMNFLLWGGIAVAGLIIAWLFWGGKKP